MVEVRYDIRNIEAALSKVHGSSSTVSYFGDTSDEDRQKAIQDFQFGDADFCANPRPQAMA